MVYNTPMSLTTFRKPEMFLSREMQFCTICHTQGKGWVRVANVADMVELRQGRNEAAAMKAYHQRRRSQARKHLRAEHPEITLG